MIVRLFEGVEGSLNYDPFKGAVVLDGNSALVSDLYSVVPEEPEVKKKVALVGETWEICCERCDWTE